MAANDKTNETTSAVPLTTDAAGAATGSAAAAGGGTQEAKSRFNSALDEAKAGADYFSIMQANSEVLAMALQCS